MGRVLGGDGAARTRRPPSPDRLSAERIVAVAVGQLRGRGYDAVTMRSIAHELGTGPASLYAHVASRAELDRLVVDRVCGQWKIPDPDPDRWDDQLRRAMLDLLGLYRANPGVARCTLGAVWSRESLPGVTDRLVALLPAGRVAEQDRAWFVEVATRYVASIALEEDLRDEARHDPTARSRASRDDRCAFGIELLVGGLKALEHHDR